MNLVYFDVFYCGVEGPKPLFYRYFSLGKWHTRYISTVMSNMAQVVWTHFVMDTLARLEQGAALLCG